MKTFRLWKPRTPRAVMRWGLLWRSCSARDGEQTHIVLDGYMPILFRTRRAARAFANEKYGYIKDRPDLRAEPHGWRMPKPVQVMVQVRP